jgi:transcriptional regulator with XRE-family HTH domain
MSKLASAVESLPLAAATALRKLGADLAIARKRRGQSLREWATRVNVSVPTLMKMEKGDPSVSAGVYATALWLIKRHGALAEVAEPRDDLAALEAEIRLAEQRHKPRSERGG